MTNLITKICGFLKKETTEYDHIIHMSNITNQIENKDIAKMLNYTNDMVTTIHDIIKPKLKKSTNIDGFHLYPTIKSTINMNKLKIIETYNNNIEYDNIIYEAYNELQQKYLNGLITESELQQYYEKHVLIINYFKSQENDLESFSSDENLFEQNSLLVAGFEEGEGSSITTYPPEQIAKQQSEFLQKLAADIQNAQLQKQQIEVMTQEQYNILQTITQQMEEAKQQYKDKSFLATDTFNPISLSNTPIQYLNIDKITKAETLKKVLTNWGQHAIGMIPLLSHFEYHEFGAYIVSLWEGRALKWLNNYISTHTEDFNNMFKESRKTAIYTIINKLYTDFTGYNIEDSPQLEEKLTKIQLWDIQYIDEFITKYFDLILDLKDNKTFWLTKIFDKLPYPWNKQIKQKYYELLNTRNIIAQTNIETLHNLGDVKKSINETIQEACQQMNMQKEFKTKIESSLKGSSLCKDFTFEDLQIGLKPIKKPFKYKKQFIPKKKKI